MDSRIVEALAFVHSYAGHIDDWLVIKKELLKALPPQLRSLFSLRDPVTKKQRTNAFERELAESWSELTGRKVLFTEDGAGT
jgi:gamma-glutamyl phosphate reductase